MWRGLLVGTFIVVVMLSSMSSTFFAQGSSPRHVDPRLLFWKVPLHCSLNEHDADWERRLAKRGNAVEFIKTQPDYLINLESSGRPKTPDVEGRSVSKRRWEASVMRWRRELHVMKRRRVPEKVASDIPVQEIHCSQP